LVSEVWFGDLNTPYTVLWHPVSNRVFCATYCGAELDTVFVVDCVTDEIVERRPVGCQPRAMCWNPVNKLVYAAERYAIYVLSLTGDSVVAQVAGYAGDVCAVPFPNKLYSASGPGLRVIDCYTHTILDSMALSAGVFVCDTVKAKVYATGNPVPVIDARTDSLVMTIPMGRSSECICWNSTSSRVYINDNMDDVVYVIRDTSTGISEQAGVPVARKPAVSTLHRGSLEIRASSGVALYDAAGRLVFKVASGAARRASLKPGAYFVRYDDADEVEKVVVVR